jgi:hypothetical protein
MEYQGIILSGNQKMGISMGKSSAKTSGIFGIRTL